MKPLTQQRLRDLLHYNPDTGEFRWVGRRRGVRIDAPPGRVSPAHGYLEIGIDYAQHRAHRLAFLYMTGAFPPGDVDHINGDKTDNRWQNLRPATRSENAINSRLRTNNTSGAHGVVWEQGRKTWRAQIRIGGQKVNLGRFSKKEDAVRAYAEAARRHHGAFAPAHALTHDDTGHRHAEGVRAASATL